MEVPKLIILLCCTYYSFASHHSHTIPVEGYDTELQDLGEHVDHHETPVKVIKITKTVAVKVPVPYPVKVIEKVPYPVHISKPYPVPVPQIIKVPQTVSPKHGHEALDVGSQSGGGGGDQGHSYQVQEGPSQDSADNGYSFLPNQESSYNGGSSGHGQNIESYSQEYPSDEGSSVSSYDVPSQSYYGSRGAPDGESFESRSYEQAIQDYLSKNHPSGGFTGGSNGYNQYH